MKERKEKRERASPGGRGLTRRSFLWGLAGGAAVVAGLANTTPPTTLPRRPVRRRRRPKAERVIIIGFDGLDYGLMSRWLEGGHLPNFARLAAEGTFRPLATTEPAESPVAWAAFSICANPGRTGIFDFLTKPVGSYYPTIALAHEEERPFHPELWLRAGVPVAGGALVGGGVFGLERLFGVGTRRALLAAVPAGLLTSAAGLHAALSLLPRKLPTPVRDRLGVGFWCVAGSAGIGTVVLQAPVCFPAEEVPNGRLLCGLGVPDIRETWGTSVVYDSAAEGLTDTEMGCQVVGVRLEGEVARAEVVGPPNFLRSGQPPTTLPLRLTLHRRLRSVTIELAGQSQTIAEGQWSDFFEFPFRLNPLVGVVGLGRFYAVECSRRLRLYLSQISIHPGHVPPQVNLSWPHDYAAELYRRIGPYKTLGWAIDTWALNTGLLDEEAFLDDLHSVMGQREAMLMSEMERGDWQLLFMLFQATDRVQHMFWRFLDRRHPSYDPRLAERYRQTILRVYRNADRILGRVLSRLRRGDVLMVISDHGFAPFAKAVNLNTYLARRGFLRLTDTGPVRARRLEDLFGRGEFWPNVDWSRTEAFALGLSQVYLNTTWREPAGIVHPGRDYRRTRERVAKALAELTDPATGKPVVHRVLLPDEVYEGEGMGRAPDLVVCLKRGYRISWQTALGGVPAEVIETNRARWSGDHCSIAAELIPGVLFANLRLPARRPRLIDVGTTALDLLGVSPTREMDGVSLLAGGEST